MNSQMKFKTKKVIQIITLVPLILFLSSCGGQAFNPGGADSQTTLPGGIATPPPPPDTVTNLPPAITRSFKLQDTATPDSVCANPTPSGVTVGSFAVSGILTDNVLKVTVKS